MVDFVRPDFLGTRQEFSNMFERPILNGQCIDSTPQDVRLMRYRSHVLHSLLEGFVQRWVQERRPRGGDKNAILSVSDLVKTYI